MQDTPAGSGAGGEVVLATVPLLPRLLRALLGLKQVIVNAAHFLVLADKATYRFDPDTPFLQMVSWVGVLGAARVRGNAQPSPVQH